MIHSLEDKTKRELIEICNIQLEEYQQLTKQFNYVVDLYESRIENMEKDRGEVMTKHDSKTEWHKPHLVPAIKKGTEGLFWVAVRNGQNKVYVFDALYQNRPLETDDDGEPLDDGCLINVDGEPIESIGWVHNQQHSEFDNFYQPIDFNEHYELLGWAECKTPEWIEL